MAVFKEDPRNDAGESIDEAAGIVSIPEFDKIEGNLNNGGDYDFYELRLDSDAEVDVKSSLERPVTLFNPQGDVVSPGDDNNLSFSGEEGDTFFLQVGQTTPEDGIFTQAIIPYEVTLDVNTGIPDGAIDAIGDLFDNYVFGTEEDDTLNGDSKDEILLGYNGDDTLNGFKGNDTLVGGQGSDLLNDGEGKDIFKYFNLNESRPGSNLRDRVDLDPGVDRIDLSAIDANLDISEDRAFDFIGTRSFGSSSNGQVRYIASKDLIQVEVHGDGDREVDFEIQSSNDFSSLSEGDFIL